jgi:hypothetical protein
MLRMHPSPKQEIFVTPLSVPLTSLSKVGSKPATTEAKSERLGLESMAVGGNTLLPSLRDYLSKLQTHKAEVDRRIQTVQDTIEIFESSGG